MQTPKNRYTEPKISPESHDMSVDWYVWFRFFDPVKQQWKQLRYKKGINEFKDLKERLTEATALKEALARELKAGWNPLEPEQLYLIKLYSLEEGLNFILKIKSTTLRAKSNYAYRYIVKLFLTWLTDQNMAGIEIKKFTATQAQSYMDYLLLKKGYSGRTFNDHLVVLRTLFNCFIDREWITKNPFRSVKWKPQTTGRNLAFTDPEKDLLTKALRLKSPRLYYFTQFIYHCFIRRTEMVNIRVRDVDLRHGTIVIAGASAKNNTQESVVIPAGLEPILREMKLHMYAPDDYLFGRGLQTGPKKYCNPNQISTNHNTEVKKLGIDPDKGLYSWKHTGVCKYYQATKDIYALMRQLRHREMKTTQIYLKSLGLVQNDVIRNVMIA